MVETIYCKNFFGVKSYFDVDVILKTENKKTIVIKSWNGKLKKLKFNDIENCYSVDAEI